MQSQTFDMAGWDAAMFELPSRAESLSDATSAFTPTVFLDALLQPKDQIVYGRRGTGKTHLFRRLLAEYDPKDFEQHRTIAVYIDASEFNADTYGTESLPKIIALDIFGQLVKRMAGELSTFLTTRLDPSRLERTLGTGKAKQLTIVRQQASLLSELVETGKVHYLPLGEASQTTKSLHETATDAKAGVSVNLTDLHAFGVKLGASADAARSASKSSLHTLTISGRLYLPFTEIAKAFREWLESVSAEHLVVMIDEWSAIDFDAQPYLAHLLKRIRQSSSSPVSKVHLKLGCIPIRTQLSLRQESSPIPIGLEEGDDIYPDADLDRAVYFDRQDNMSLVFLQDILQRHAAQSLTWVGSLEPLAFTEFIRSSVFASDLVFSELCWASAGVPRDFLDMMSKATRAKVTRSAEKITFRDVREVVRPVYEARVKDIPAQSIMLNKEVYRKIVFPNRSFAEFLLSDELAQTPDVSTLWAERLWHLSPERFVDQETGNTYQRYRIDYGMYVDLVRSSKAADQPWENAIGGAAQITAGAVIGAGFGGILTGVIAAVASAVAAVYSSNEIHEIVANSRPIGKQIFVEPDKLIADSIVRAMMRSNSGKHKG